MSENKGGEKKVSIGEALDAIRSGRNLPAEAKSNGAPKLPTGNFEYQRVSPAYWLDNLQEGIQRSRDQLFDSIANNPKAANGMSRRDLHASEAFYVPSEWMDEVDLTAPEKKVVQPANPDTTEVSLEATLVQSSGESPGTDSETSRFKATEEMNLNSPALQVEEIESETEGGETRLRINPMIREIFKKKAEGGESQ